MSPLGIILVILLIIFLLGGFSGRFGGYGYGYGRGGIGVSGNPPSRQERGIYPSIFQSHRCRSFECVGVWWASRSDLMESRGAASTRSIPDSWPPDRPGAQ